MKAIILFAACILSFSCYGQKNPSQDNPAPAAKKYEMKEYYFVLLTKGARRGEITDTTILNKLQEGHMANITRLAEMGKLLVAGPFGDDGNWRGIFIFDAISKEEVEGYLKTDPAIAAGRLDYEIHPWWTAKNAVFR